MRHAEHFLSRLDRLAGSEVETALELYRDPDLLRLVLAEVALPEAASRVAVSLADPVEGPFLVVTRDGHFVTCLARGMKPGELPIVTRGQLDALSQKFTTLRERLKLATRLTGKREGACDMLLRRVLCAADSVSREDFLAVSAWEPLLGPDFLQMGGEVRWGRLGANARRWTCDRHPGGRGLGGAVASEVPDEVRTRVLGCSDPTRLVAWLRLAVSAESAWKLLE